jgi:hypothetical protein
MCRLSGVRVAQQLLRQSEFCAHNARHVAAPFAVTQAVGMPLSAQQSVSVVHAPLIATVHVDRFMHQ